MTKRRRLVLVRKMISAMLVAMAAAVTTVALTAVALPAAASAEDTVWICKPGQADDLCAGSIAGSTWHDPGPAKPLGFTRPEAAPVDCFYVYPTVSEQPTPNANLDKDPEVRRVVVQQARMFSRICDVYAPMYRQETSPGVYSSATEVAYQSALGAWKDYLANYNHGRGVILLGHSQGSATLGRLIDEEIDPDPAARSLLVGAILPGANIFVPKGETVGGMYDNIAVCSQQGDFGCLVAYSTYNGYPGDAPDFSNLASGYWAYKIDRPDPAAYEAVCVDPGALAGTPGKLTPLVNFDYLTGTPEQETPASWRSFPGKMTAACAREGGDHWLDVDLGPSPDPFLTMLIETAASGNNYHVPEVNLAEENLVTIAGLQAERYTLVRQKLNDLRSRRAGLAQRWRKAKLKVTRLARNVTRLKKKVKSAKGKKRKVLKRRLKSSRRQAKAGRKRAKALAKRVRSVDRQISQMPDLTRPSQPGTVVAF